MLRALIRIHMHRLSRYSYICQTTNIDSHFKLLRHEEAAALLIINNKAQDLPDLCVHFDGSAQVYYM